MMKQAFTKLGVFTLLSLLCPAFLYAQVVTDERMFSFEDPQVPECISATRSQLSISDTHYKDGKHSMEWAFNPGGCLLPSLAPRCSARSGCAPSHFARPPLPAPSSRFLLCSHSSASPPPLPAPRRPPPARLLSPPSSSIRPSSSPPGQTDQNYPFSPHTQNTPKMPLPATIHVLNVYE